MTPTPSNDLTTPAADSSAEMIKLARQATARIVTAALEATAEAADMERSVLARTSLRLAASAALAALPPALQQDPQQIRDFTRSPAYRDLVDRYVQGGLEGHLLTRAMALLGQCLPAAFAG